MSMFRRACAVLVTALALILVAAPELPVSTLAEAVAWIKARQASIVVHMSGGDDRGSGECVIEYDASN